MYIYLCRCILINTLSAEWSSLEHRHIPSSSKALINWIEGNYKICDGGWYFFLEVSQHEYLASFRIIAQVDVFSCRISCYSLEGWMSANMMVSLSYAERLLWFVIFRSCNHFALFYLRICFFYIFFQYSGDSAIIALNWSWEYILIFLTYASLAYLLGQFYRPLVKHLETLIFPQHPDTIFILYNLL